LIAAKIAAGTSIPPSAAITSRAAVRRRSPRSALSAIHATNSAMPAVRKPYATAARTPRTPSRRRPEPARLMRKNRQVTTANGNSAKQTSDRNAVNW